MANNVTVIDGNSVAQVYKTTDTASVHTSHINVDAWPGVAESDLASVETNMGLLAGAVTASVVQTDVNSVTLPGTIRNYQVTIATPGTELQFVTGATPLSAVVLIRAHADNTGAIYVGGASVTSTTGYILAPGESVPLSVADLSSVWIDAETASNKASCLGS